MCLAMGDGCLHYIRNAGKLYGGLTIGHCKEQADILKWKASLLSKIFNRTVNVRPQSNGALQVSVCVKRLRSWRKWCYPNNSKDLSRMLRFVEHPEMALAMLLIDDGYIEPSISKIKSGKKLYGGRVRIYLCSESIESLDKIRLWFSDNFNVNVKFGSQKSSKRNKHYPYLKFGQADSLKLWEYVREFILQFKSMRYKFRYIETIYQQRLLQRQTLEKGDDIVSARSNTGI